MTAKIEPKPKTGYSNLIPVKGEDILEDGHWFDGRFIGHRWQWVKDELSGRCSWLHLNCDVNTERGICPACQTQAPF